MSPKTSKRPGLLIFLCFLAYGSAYLCRYSYNANVASVMAEYAVDHTSAGLVTTFFFFSYGLGQLLHGVLSKYYNKKYVIGGAMLLSAILNLLVYFGVGFAAYKFIWLAVGILQSALWPSLVGLLGEQLDEKYHSRSILVMSTTIAAGTFAVYGISALFTRLGNYKLTFLTSPILLIFAALVWFFLYDRCVCPKEEKPKEKSVSEVSVSKKKYTPMLLALIATVCFFSVVDNLLRDGLTEWMPSVLRENFALEGDVSVLLTLILPLFAAFAALLNGFFQRFTKDPVMLCTTYFAVAGISVLAAYLLLDESLPLPFLFCLGIAMLLMNGVNAVTTGNTPLYLRDKADPGFLAGLFNAFCYVGSTGGSVGLGAVADYAGWKTVFLILLAACALSVLAGVLFIAFQKFFKKRKTDT